MLYYGHNYVDNYVSRSDLQPCIKTLMAIVTTRKTTNTDKKHKLL